MTRTSLTIRPPRVPLRLRTVVALTVIPTLTLLNYIPLRRRTQAVIAEALGQAIFAGIDLAEASEVASRTVRGVRARRYLRDAARRVRAGETLGESLERCGMSLHADLRAALEIGEARGRLGAELAAAARRLEPRIDGHFARAICRHVAVREFATSLARLLADHALTVELIRDAARLVGPHDRHFRRAAERVASDMEGGCPFAWALEDQPKMFDPLFVQCVAHADTRESMRRVLARLGGGGSATTASGDAVAGDRVA